jgi:hypothetical protein
MKDINEYSKKYEMKFNGKVNELNSNITNIQLNKAVKVK